MTASLYWRPKQGGNRLPDPLRLKLRKRFDLHGVEVDERLNPTLVGYLEALAEHADGQVAGGAEDLLEAIREHGPIILELKS